MIFNKKEAPVSFWTKLVGTCVGICIVAGAVILAIMAIDHIITAAFAATAAVTAGVEAVASWMAIMPTKAAAPAAYSDKFAAVG